MKSLLDPGTRELLGRPCSAVMAVLQLAMMGKLPYDRLRDAVFAHPTLAEALNNLFATLEGRSGGERS